MSGKGERQTKKANYRTPPEFYRYLDEVFEFDTDGAADQSNFLEEHWFGPGAPETEDAFQVTAEDVVARRIFVNPPYSDEAGRPCVGEWVALMARWAQWKADLVVGLVPAGTSTQWFRDIAWRTCSEIWFVTPRVSFLNEAGEPQKGNDSDSLLLVWRGGSGPLPTAGIYDHRHGVLL